MDIKEYIKGECKFQFYKDSSLWYLTENNFLFPVPIQDIGNATFYYTDKGILFMRYIRKYLEFLNYSKTTLTV